jgi:hypothetical protein
MSSPAKTRNCVFGFPECDHQEMRGIAFDPTQRVGSLVAKDRAAIGDGDSTHKIEILIALCRRRTTMPDAGIVDCRSNPVSKGVAEGQILIFRWHIVARAQFWGWVWWCNGRNDFAVNARNSSKVSWIWSDAAVLESSHSANRSLGQFVRASRSGLLCVVHVPVGLTIRLLGQVPENRTRMAGISNPGHAEHENQMARSTLARLRSQTGGRR